MSSVGTENVANVLHRLLTKEAMPCFTLVVYLVAIKLGKFLVAGRGFEPLTFRLGGLVSEINNLVAGGVSKLISY